ncbi:MAG: hypothetical protein AAGI10_02035 [Pseudomonadota bacterium]
MTGGDSPPKSKNQVSPLRAKHSPDDISGVSSDDLTVLLAMIDKAFHAEQDAARSRDNTAFRYIAALIAVLVAVLSNTFPLISASGKVFVVSAVISLALLASMDIWSKHRQTRDLTRVLVHLENLAGCYENGRYVDNTTLLPEEWLVTDGYIGNRVGIIRIAVLWFLTLIGCVAHWFA